MQRNFNNKGQQRVYLYPEDIKFIWAMLKGVKISSMISGCQCSTCERVSRIEKSFDQTGMDYDN